MEPKPPHLGAQYADTFKGKDVADAYPNRPPYPQEVFTVLTGLINDAPRTVLDIGAGTGDIARRLAPLVDRVDAVDFSHAMIEQARRLPGGDAPTLRWIEGAVEDAPLEPSYALITAGESLHWMDWHVVFPRFHAAFAPRALIAIVERDWYGPEEFDRRMLSLIRRYSANRDFQPYDLVAELERRRLFERAGEIVTAPQPWLPTVQEYIECRHSQNGLARTAMGAAAVEFDAMLAQTLEEHVQSGVIQCHGDRLGFEVRARLVWGVPV